MTQMKVDLIIGSQFGDCGKGCMAEWLANRNQYNVAVRTGGANAGHATTAREFHNMPASCLSVPNVYIPAAGVIDVESFIEEVAWATKHNPLLNVYISPFAAIITDKGAASAFGSMGVGVGKTRIQYLQRNAKRALDVVWPVGINVQAYQFNDTDSVLVEPGQGYGLSLHSRFYPHVTTIDLNPYAILAESEVPFGADVDVWAISRFFPVRVPSPAGGSSGAMSGELPDDDQRVLDLVESETWGNIAGQRKRVSTFDFGLFREFLDRCRPDHICFSHLDQFKGDLRSFENRAGCHIDYVSSEPSKFVRRDSITA